MDPELTCEPIDAELVEEEAVDGEPVLDDAGLLSVPASAPALVSRPAPVVVQAAAAAATGFVAGAATLALVRRAGARRLTRRSARSRGGDSGLPILGTQSFLIDIHLLDKPGR